ncbi:sialidase family protein [Frankia sp. R82]|uniref:sialidase family protein n=1 Tax=Frankia sp. R82 TaxID=2950553 RepID=UPI002043F0D6|nr:sialidase family protein [Frankia sp. R82]MCM3882529.1 glycoside hydrolase [Frankia sp. R82]
MRRSAWLSALALLLTSLVLGVSAAAASGATPAGPSGASGTAGPAAPSSSPPAGVQCTPAQSHGPNRTDVRASPSQGCLYPTGYKNMSPSIQVSRTGVLFIARATGGVLRSIDGGRHWSAVNVPKIANGDDHTSGVHGYVHIDPRTDRVYYLTSLAARSCGGKSGSVISWSDNLGLTWSGRTVGCDTYDWGKLVTGPAPKGNAYPSAIYFMGVGLHLVGGQRFVYRSLNAGVTWQRMDRIASATTEAGVGATAPDGTIYFDYPEFTGFDPSRLQNTTYPYVPENKCREMIAVSEDYGVTWRQQPIPGSLACGELYGQQRVAVDRAGTVYAVWVDDTDTQLYLSYSRDRARTWSTPVNVMAPGTTFSLIHGDIVADAAGHVVIAGLQTTVPTRPTSPAGFPGLYAGPAHAIITESLNADSAQPRFTTADLDTPAASSNGSITLSNGQYGDEANAYLAFSRNGVGWAVFSRKTAGSNDQGVLTAARLFPTR